MDLAGTYEFAVNSPLGQQTGTFTVVPDASGTTFTGHASGSIGETAVNDGAITGNVLTWTMAITSPMPMTLECEATVDGDQVTGKVRAGYFGTMGLTGRKVA
jgi:hypothetical protein